MAEQDYTFSYDGISADLTPEAVKAAALGTKDFLWGTIQGNFNSKMSVSQIILDAAIGMIPLVGDVTAARDVISVIIGMVDHPEKRKEVMEWVLLVIFLLALIPVAGGLAKGTGRLLVYGVKTSAKEAGTLARIIETLNRAGFGSAKKFIQELDLLKHERAILKKFNELSGDFIALFDKILNRLNRVLSSEMKQRVTQMRDGVKAIKELGSSMIPKAVKELNAELKKVQKAIYSGEFHTVPSSGKVVTREAEARLVKRCAAKLAGKRMKYPQNVVAKDAPEQVLEKYYKHKAGWPDLRRYLDKDGKFYEYIAAFHGKIEATVVRGPATLKRVIQLDKNGVTRSWWYPPGVTPKSAQEWRINSAVLDEFGHNGYIVTCHVPTGTELKAWKGTNSSQIDEIVGQYLEGGGKQLFLDLGAAKSQEAQILETLRSGKTYTTPEGLVFSMEKTNWTDTVGVWGFAKGDDLLEAEKLGRYERQSKRVATGARLAHGAQSH